MIVTASLAALVARCAPRVGPVTMSALVAYESGGRPWAIDDDTAHRAYFPATRPQAVETARRLVLAGHAIDVGYAQLSVANFASYGLDARTAFEPCANLAAGADLLRGAYVGAARRWGPGQTALFHALSAYNSGRYDGALGYATGVFRTAGTLRAERPGPSR